MAGIRQYCCHLVYVLNEVFWDLLLIVSELVFLCLGVPFLSPFLLRFADPLFTSLLVASLVRDGQ